MKKRLIFAGLFVITLAVLQSCDRKAKTEMDRKAELFKKLMVSVDDTTTYHGGIMVPKDLAMACINNYDRIYKDDRSLVRMSRAYSDCVSFGNKRLFKFMFDMADSTNVDNMRVFFGVYTEALVKAYPQYHLKKDRLTVFIWPYHGDERAVYTKYGNGPHGGHGGGGHGGGTGGPKSDTTGGYNLGNLMP